MHRRSCLSRSIGLGCSCFVTSKAADSKRTKHLPTTERSCP
jgi:hypothetical protein